MYSQPSINLNAHTHVYMHIYVNIFFTCNYLCLIFVFTHACFLIIHKQIKHALQLRTLRNSNGDQIPQRRTCINTPCVSDQKTPTHTNVANGAGLFMHTQSHMPAVSAHCAGASWRNINLHRAWLNHRLRPLQSAQGLAQGWNNRTPLILSASYSGSWLVILRLFHPLGGP